MNGGYGFERIPNRSGGRGSVFRHFGRLRQLQLFPHEDAVAFQMVRTFQGIDRRAMSLGNADQGVAGFDHVNARGAVDGCGFVGRFR